jgi:hypothetical protein
MAGDRFVLMGSRSFKILKNLSGLVQDMLQKQVGFPVGIPISILVQKGIEIADFRFLSDQEIRDHRGRTTLATDSTSE